MDFLLGYIHSGKAENTIKHMFNTNRNFPFNFRKYSITKKNINDKIWCRLISTPRTKYRIN